VALKLGIVGSSYSVGRHHNPITQQNNLALPFETWFTDIDVVNSACASKGTELYLNKVLHLKKQHNIDTLLLEVINNRSMLNVKTQSAEYKSIWKETDIDNILIDVYSNNSSMYKYQRYIHQEIDHTNFGTEKEFKSWKRFQESIAADCTMNEFWALCDIKQTIDLCTLLNIKVVAWAHHWHMEQIPVFDSAVQDATYVKFPDYMNAHDYYVNMYTKDNVLCDTCHFNDNTNKQLVQDFLLPALTNQ
jgi:hypothetical protein